MKGEGLFGMEQIKFQHELILQIVLKNKNTMEQNKIDELLESEPNWCEIAG